MSMTNHYLEIRDKLFDLVREPHKPINVNKEHENSLSFQDKIALAVTSAVGTMYAVYVFALFMGIWMGWQLFMESPFDPYPFAFLLFIGNIVQLLLMPLIMVGQNIQSRHSQLRSDEQYRMTKASFDDVEMISKHLQAQDKELLHQTQLLQDLITMVKSKA